MPDEKSQIIEPPIEKVVIHSESTKDSMEHLCKEVRISPALLHHIMLNKIALPDDVFKKLFNYKQTRDYRAEVEEKFKRYKTNAAEAQVFDKNWGLTLEGALFPKDVCGFDTILIFMGLTVEEFLAHPLLEQTITIIRNNERFQSHVGGQKLPSPQYHIATVLGEPTDTTFYAMSGPIYSSVIAAVTKFLDLPPD